MLFEPFEDGLRTVRLDNTDDCVNVSRSHSQRVGSYSLVVVDEAHHIYSSTSRRATVEKHIDSGARRLLLSDISQSRGAEIDYPQGMTPVELTQIVRSTQRIVEGANAFRCDASAREDAPRCYHSSVGPPLVPFIFDHVEAQQYETYAAETLRALQHVTITFRGLRLHDRLAIIVSDARFRTRLKAQLESALKYSGNAHLQSLELVDAQQASRADVHANSPQKRKGKEWLVLDTVEEFDGLERLIIIAVGLDSPIEDGVSTLDTRSRLYRALTRGHMMVLVVNERVAGGWLEFLGKVEYDAAFDSERERQRGKATRR